jgi:hypothetical protein
MERKMAIAMVLSELQITGGWKDLGYGCYLGFEGEAWVITDKHGRKLVISEEVANDLVGQWIDEL